MNIDFRKAAAAVMILLSAAGSSYAQQQKSGAFSSREWQWAVPVEQIISSETGAHPEAFLWIPPNCRQVRGVVIGQHNMLEEGIFEHAAFRKNLAKLGFAEVWITPGPDLVFNYQQRPGGAAFRDMLKSLGEVSGYSELAFAPVVPLGHSAAASYPWNYGAWDPAGTLAMISVHGDAPLSPLTGSGQPNPDWGKSNIDGIPGLFIMGEYEWWEDRLKPAMDFRKAHPRTPLALLSDAGHGHFDYSDQLVEFINLFLTKAAGERLPARNSGNQPVKLRPVDPEKGWLADRWRNNAPPRAMAAPYAAYRGNPAEAGWAFDREMALATENYYAGARGKKNQHMVYTQQGKMLPSSGFSGFRPSFIPLEDGISFQLSAIFTDTVQGRAVRVRPQQPVRISRICGPVEKLNDSTFRIAFYRMGMNNTKRSNDIWLMAEDPGNAQYKPAVQQANMKIPVRNTAGRAQQISFPAIPRQSRTAGSLQLNAVSDAGVPVSYYVREGPAYVSGNQLIFTGIPPKTRFPVKVTVVAWQYGNSGSPQLQSAEPVTQSFYIDRRD